MMTTPYVEPYLHLAGRCEEALEFYQRTLGAEPVMVMRFKESPEPSPMPLPEGWDEKIMHCGFKIGSSLIMASDGCGGGEAPGGFSLSLTMPDEEAAKQVFEALAEGGKITMPPGRTFWSPCFGMVADRFGVHWMVTVPMEEGGQP